MIKRDLFVYQKARIIRTNHFPDPIDRERHDRMVADLGDNERALAVLPGGVSGRWLTGHYRDQIGPFMTGEKLYWWFSDREIAAHRKTEQILAPR